ncbi:MAG: replication initiation protein, partial [Cetobacterium sp.]
MGKIVQYDSKLNNLNFGKFKEKELDLFFAICYKLKEQGLDEITLSFQELKELSNYSRNDVKRLISDIESTYTKLLDIKLEIIISPKVREKFVLFTKYRIDEEKKEMTIQLQKEYRFVLNDIDKFTKFDLIEFSNLKSSYARNMFRLLKQFDNKKNLFSWYEVKIETFKELLGVPSCYKMINIDKKILIPIMDQLKPLFPNLKLEKIKKGVKVVALKFTWNQKKKKDPKIVPMKVKASIGEKEHEEDMLLLLERDKGILNSVQDAEAENPLWEKFLELPPSEQAAVEEIVYKNYIAECGVSGKVQELAFNAGKKLLITKFLENNPVETPKIEYKDIEFTQTKIYTAEDIPSEKLLDKNGNKLKGMLLANRINKILLELNKG